MSLLARKRKLTAKKIDGAWYTTRAILEEYLKRQHDRAQLLNADAARYREFIPKGSSAPFTAVTPEPHRLRTYESDTALVANAEPEHAAQTEYPTPSAVEKISTPLAIRTEQAEQSMAPQTAIASALPAPAPAMPPPQAPAPSPANDDAQFAAFMRKFDAYLDRSVHERHAGIAHRIACYLRDGARTIRTKPSAAIPFVLIFLLLAILPFRFVSGYAEDVYGRVLAYAKDAQTVMGFRPGTHENEILLLGPDGQIAIEGHIETDGQYKSFAEQGIAPILVTSTTKVENLNVDYLDDLTSTEFTLAFVTKNGNITYEDVYLEGLVEVGKTLDVGETLLVHGATRLLETLEVSGKLSALDDAVFHKAVTVEGKATFRDLIEAERLVVHRDARVEGILNVMSDAAVTGSVSVGGGVTAQTLRINGVASIGGDFIAGGNVSLGSPERSAYITSMTWEVDNEGAAEFNTLKVRANSNLHGDFTVYGSTLLDTLSVENELTIGGQATFSSSATTTFAGPIASATSTLIVASGSAGDLLLNPYGGNVGIGTTSPSDTLAIEGAAYFGNISAPAVSLNRLYANAGDLYWAGSVIGGATTGQWTTDGTHVWRAGGNVGVGTSSPYAKLSVVGQTVSEYFTATSTSSASTFPYASSTALTISGNAYFPGSGIWNSSGRIGIGTTSPNNLLAIQGAAPQISLYDSTNNRQGTIGMTDGFNLRINAGVGYLQLNTGGQSVGIGTTTPATTFSVTGSGYLTGGLGVGVLNTAAGTLQTSGNGTIGGVLAINGTSGTTTIAAGQGFTIGSSQFVLQQGSGNVGIGTASPTNPLHVYGGSAHTRQKVESAGAFVSGISLKGGAYEWTIDNRNTFDTPNNRFAISDQSAGAERLTIDSSGNIGIGTTSPGAHLDISQPSANGIDGLRIGNNNAYELKFVDSGSGSNAANIYQSVSNQALYISTNGGDLNLGASTDATHLVVKSTGNVGVGTTSPYAKLSVVGPVVAEYFHATSSTATSTFAGGFSAASSLYVLQNGNVGIGTTSPTSGFKLDVNGGIRISDTSGMLNLPGNNVDQRIEIGANTSNVNRAHLSVTGTNPSFEVMIGGTQITQWNANNFQVNKSISRGTNFELGVEITNTGPGAAGNVLYLNQNSFTPTSGTVRGLYNVVGFQPTSGTADFRAMEIAGTINQTGGASGIARGVYINPTLTAAADWRALEIASNSGKAIYQTGASATNYLAGLTGIGTTTPWAQLSASSTSANPALAVQQNSTGAAAVFLGGNVGIGTASPSARLHAVTSAAGTSAKFGDGINSELAITHSSGNFVNVFGTAASTLVLSGNNLGSSATRLTLDGSTATFSDNTNATIAVSFPSSGVARILGTTGSALRLGANNADVLTMLTGGNVGIGDTTPSYLLDVAGIGRFTSLVDASHFVATSTTATSTFAGGLTVDTSDFVVDPDAGRVGIGTASPQAPLHVMVDGAGIGARFGDSSNTNYLEIASGGVLTRFKATGNRPMTFETDSSERLRIDGSGNVGIGTTSPASLLSVAGNGYFTGKVGIGTANPTALLSVTDGSVAGAAFTIDSGGAAISFTRPSINYIRATDASGSLNFGTGNILGRLTIGSEGNFNFNSGQMFIQQSNGNVGIGTTSPYRTLSVAGSGVFTGGDVLGSTFTATSSISAPSFTLTGTGANMLLSTNASGGIVSTSTPTAAAYLATSTTATSTFAGGFSAASSLYVLQNGNVGIGTAGPTNKLQINTSGSNTAYIGYTSAGSTLGGLTGVDIGGNLYLWNTDAKTLYLGTNNAARLTIDSVGAATFSSTLTTGGQITSQVANSYGIRVQQGSSNGSFYFGAASAVATPDGVFSNNAGTELVRITNGGNVGIGTTTPNNKLDIYSATKAALGFNTNSGLSNWTIGQDASDGYKFKISSSTALGTNDRFVIDGSGLVGIGTSSLTHFLTLPSTVSANSVNGASASGGKGIALYNTVDQTTNYQRGTIYMDTQAGDNTFMIRTESGGSGTQPGLLMAANGISLDSGAGRISLQNSASTIDILAQMNKGFYIFGDVRTAANTPNIQLGTFGTLITTSGTSQGVRVANSFMPTSGTAVFNDLEVQSNINQTGGANGITRGLYVNPTLTAAADWRALEIASNSGYGIYQTGASATNYFAGLTGFGTTTPWAQLSASSTSANPALAVQQNSTGAAAVFLGGNVGIGMTSPGVALDVAGTIRAGSRIQIGGSSGPLFRNSAGTMEVTNSAETAYANLTAATITSVSGSPIISGGYVQLNTSSGPAIRDNSGAIESVNSGQTDWYPFNAKTITAKNGGNLVSDSGVLQIGGTGNSYITGNVGIGDTTPSYLLDVAGVGRFTSLIDASHFVATSTTATSTFAGGLTVDTSDFVVDPDAGRVGIGTISPERKLEVVSLDDNGSSALKLTSNNLGQNMQLGWAGITNSSAFTLVTSGRIILNNNSTGGLSFQNSGGSALEILNSGNVGIGTTTPSGNLVVNGTTGQNLFQIATSTNQGVLVVNQHGNVGIGTNNPYSSSKLDIAGNLNIGNDVNTTQHIYFGGASTGNRYVRLQDLGFRVNWYSDSNGGRSHMLAFNNFDSGLSVNDLGKLFLAPASFGFSNTFSIDPNRTTSVINAGYVTGGDNHTTNLTIRTQNTGGNGNLNSGNIELITGSPRNSGVAGYIGFQTNNTERMRISTDGNVGIGTTSPYAKLTTWGTGSLFEAVTNASTTVFSIGQSGATTTSFAISSIANGLLSTNASGSVVATSTLASSFLSLTEGYTLRGSASNTAEATSTLFVAATGRVGIGDTNPSAMLEIANNASLAELTFSGTGTSNILSDSATALFINTTAAAPIHLGTGASGATHLTVASGGNVGIGDTTPSYLLDVAGVGRFTSLVDASHFVATSTTATSTFAGGLTVDTSDFVVDPDAGRVGIGTANPLAGLDVNNVNGVRLSYASNNTLTVRDSGGTWQALDVWADQFAVNIDGSGTNEFVVTSAGNVNITGLSTLTGGFVSQASSTVAGTLTAGHLIPMGPYTSNLSSYDLGATGSRWNALWAGTLNIGTSTWSINNGSDGRLSIFDAASGGGTERLSVTTGGNVGVGTTSPTRKLSVEDSANAQTYLGSFINWNTGGSASAGIQIGKGYGADQSGVIEYNSTGNYLGLHVAGDNAGSVLNIAKGGLVGIGTTTPNNLLTVHGSLPQLSLYDSTNNRFGTIGMTDGFNLRINTSAGYLQLNTGGQPVGIGTTTPATTLSVTGSGYFTGGLGVGVLNTTAGTIQTSGNATIGGALTLGTDLTVANGGTGASTFTSGGILFGNGTSAIGATVVLTNGQLLIGDGSGAPTLATLTAGNLVTITNGAGSITVAVQEGAGSGLDADTLDAIDSLQFLRSDTSDSYTSGTLTFDATTLLDLNTTGLSIADTDIAFDGASTNFNMTGNLTVNTDDLVIDKTTGNVGIGTTTPNYKLAVVGSGSGSVSIGDVFGSGNYAGISLNGTATAGSGTYNFLSAPNDSNLYINRPSARAISFRENNGTDQMTILSGGNVGIGTTSPTEVLSVTHATTPTFNLASNDGTEFLRVLGSGGANYIQSGLTRTSGSAADLHFTDIFAANTWMTIKSTGLVGIGTTTPATTLSVAGSGYFTSGLGVGVLNTTAGTLQTSGAATLGGALTVSTGGAAITGNSTIAGTLSSLTGLTSSGTITFSGLTATRVVCTTTGGALTVSCTSAGVAASVSDETGSGALVFGTSPTISSPTFTGTIASGLTASRYVTTDASGNLAVSGASANLAATLTDETGTGVAVFGTSPTFTTQITTPIFIANSTTGTSTIAGGLTVDTSDFVVDPDAGRVGIGTAAPVAPLSVGSSQTNWTNTASSSVIGSASLPTSLDAFNWISEFRSTSANVDRLLIGEHRTVAGSDWTTAAWRIQPAVDNSFTGMSGNRGYLELAHGSVGAYQGVGISGAGNTTPDVVVNSSGNVGIGTTTPGTKLHITAGDNTWQAYFGNIGQRVGLWSGTGPNRAILGTPDAGAQLRLNIGGTDYVTIGTTGNVGIGSTSPMSPLVVVGTARASNWLIGSELTTEAGTTGFTNANGPGIQYWGSASAQSGSLVFNAGAAERIRLTSGGNVGIGSTSPATTLGVTGSGYFTSGLGVGKLNTTAGTIKATGSIDTDTQFLGQPSDTVSTPSFSWTGDTTTGLYRPAASQIGFAIAGVNKATLTSSGLTLADDLTVANGGTGASTFTDGGILFGNGTGAIGATAVLTNGQLLIGDGTQEPTAATLTAGNLVTITNGAGSITVAVQEGSGSGLDADTLDTLDSLQFLRSDTSDSYTSGTLTFDATTLLDLNTTGLSIADTDIAFDGASTNFNMTGNLTVNTDDLVVSKSAGSIGIGTASIDAAAILHAKGSVLAENTASSASTTRNAGFRVWNDEAFGMDLHFGSTTLGQSTSWATALYGRSSDTVALRFGNYAAAATAQGDFNELMTLTNAGNLGIGTTTPWGRLSATGAGTGTGTTFVAANSSNSPLFTVLDNGTVGVGTVSSRTSSIYGVLLANASNASTTPNITLLTTGAGQGELSDLAFYSTFVGSGDNGPRRTADIVAGFNGGTWGNEYLAFNVGFTGGANDGRLRTLERMRIQQDGNVGIGTTSPSSILAIDSGSAGTTLTTNTAASTADLWNILVSGAARAKITKNSSGDIDFTTTGAGIDFLFNPAGNVGIGTTSPTQEFSVDGDIRTTDHLYLGDQNGANGKTISLLSYDDVLYFRRNSSSDAFEANVANININSGLFTTTGGMSATTGAFSSTLSATGLATLASGFVSQASSTVVGNFTTTGTLDGVAADFSSTLTLSGTAANIALGSNWLSGDGGDEGIQVSSTGIVTLSTDLAVTEGGTGASTFTGLLIGNGTSAFTATTLSSGIAGQITDETGSGALVFAGSPTLTGSLTITSAANNGIELGRVDGTGSTPFIDFHSGATAVDHDVRLLASGGTGANGGGTLNITAATLAASGAITEAGSAVQSAADLDTCAEFAALGAIETGTCGSLVLSVSPTLTTPTVTSGDNGIKGSSASSWLAINGDPAGFGTGPSIIMRGSASTGDIDFYHGSTRNVQFLSSGTAAFTTNITVAGTTATSTFAGGLTVDTSDFVVDPDGGRVGIGTASPGYKLQAALGSNEIAAFNDAVNASAVWGMNIGFISEASEARVTTRGSVPLVFLTGGTLNSMTEGTEWMRITTSGNVGIGTTTPLGKLETFSGEIIANGYGSGSGQLRMIGGDYGAFFRNDGANTYFLLTAINDEYGAWTTARPLIINNSTGAVSINQTGSGLTSIGNTSATLAINSTAFNVSTAGVISGATGLTSSGTITFSGLTATRAVCTTTGGALTVSCTSAGIAASVSDETGTGSLVFSASPTLTGTVTTAAVTASGRVISTGGLAASSDMASSTGSLGAFEARSEGTGASAGAAFITFHRPSAFAAYLGIDTDNKLKVGGWSMGANAYSIWHDGVATDSILATTLLDKVDSTTGTGALVFGTSPTIASPTIASPTFSGTIASGLTASRYVTTDASGNLAVSGASANLAATLTDETGTGNAVFSASPTFTGTAAFANTTNSGTLAVTGIATFSNAQTKFTSDTASLYFDGTGNDGLGIKRMTANDGCGNWNLWGGAYCSASTLLYSTTGSGFAGIRQDFEAVSGAIYLRVAGTGTAGATISPIDFTFNTSGLTLASGLQFLPNNADSATVPAYSWSGDTNVGMFRPTTDTIGFTTAGSERVRIDSSGNVGIGTTSPGSKLEIATGSNTSGLTLLGAAYNEIGEFYMGANGALIMDITAGSDTQQFIDLRPEDDQWGLVLRESDGTGTGVYANFYVTDATDDYLAIGVNSAVGGTDELVVTAAGLVGIGTSTPAASLFVAGTNDGVPDGSGVSLGTSGSYGSIELSGTSGGFIDFTTVGTDSKGRILYDNTSNFMTLSTNNAEKVRITSTGLVGIGTTTPNAALSVWDTTSTIFNVGHDTAEGFRIIDWTDGHQYIDFKGNLYFRDGIGGVGGTSPLTILDGGNVGIGDTTPSTALDVNGVLSFGGTAVLNTGNAPSDIYANIRVIRNTSATSADGMYIGYGNSGTTAGDLRFYANGTTQRMIIKADTGNVGISNTAPNAILTVGTNGSGTGRQLTLGAWADVSAAGGGQGLFGGNAYMLSSGSTFAYSNTHASIGAMGFAVNYPAWNQASVITSGTSSSTAGMAFTPTVVATFTNAGLVGIGTTSPVGRFAVVSDDNTLATNIGEFRALNLTQGVGISYNGIRKLTTNATNDLFIDGASGTTGDVLLNASSGGATGNVGIGTSSPATKLSVTGSGYLTGGLGVGVLNTTAGNIESSGDVRASGTAYYGDGKNALQYSDTWLRLNQTGDFTSGIYTGTGILRNDGTFQIGSSGATLSVASGGDLTLGAGTQIDFTDEVADKLYLYSTTYGIGISSGETNWWSGGTWSWRTTSRTGTEVMNLSAAGNLQMDGTLTVGSTIAATGKIYGGNYSPTGAASVNGFSLEVGGTAPTATNGEATIFLHDHGTIAHQLRYTNGALFLEAAGNGYGTSATPDFLVGGSVGIGTTSPIDLLEVYGNTGQLLTLTRSVNTQFNQIGAYFDALDSGNARQEYARVEGRIWNNTAGSENGTLGFYTTESGTATEQMRLYHTGGLSLGSSYTGTTPPADGLIVAGTVGIGTSSPQTLLHVSNGYSGNLPSAFAELVVEDDAGAIINILSPSANSGNIYFGDATAVAVGRVVYEHLTDDMSLWTNNVERLTIDSSGDIGIGTTTPVSKLSIQGSLCVRSTGSCGTTAGTIYATTATITDIDLAENYPTLDQTLTAGEIVAFDPANPTHVKRAGGAGSFLGVVSTAPGILLGKEIPNAKPVALAGRVPVKVNMDGGAIAAGDYITLSTSTPGVGMKAVSSGHVIGVALTSASSAGAVEVFIKPEYAFLPDQLFIDSATGNVGIGTTTPSRTLTVGGEVGALGFVNLSTRDTKTDITYLSEGAASTTLKKLERLRAATYAYKADVLGGKRLGLIAEDAEQVAPEILSVDGKGVDLYKLATFTLVGVQTLAAKLDAAEVKLVSLEKRVAALESGSVTASTGTSTFSSSTLASALATFGILIDKGIAQFDRIVAQQFVVAMGPDGSASAGTGTIDVGTTTARIANSFVTTSTKVFVTFNGEVKGGWWVAEKTKGAFSVVLSELQPGPVSFDYFLVQTEGALKERAASEGMSGAAAASITLMGPNPLHLKVGDTFEEPGVRVEGGGAYKTYVNGVLQDANAETITTSAPTTYIITYTATSENGEALRAMRSVIVGNPDGTVVIADGTASAPAPEEGEPAAPTPEPEPVTTPSATTTTPAPDEAATTMPVEEKASPEPPAETDAATSTPSTPAE